MSSWEQNCKILKVSYNIIEKYVSLNFQLQILYLTWMFYGLEKIWRCHKEKKIGDDLQVLPWYFQALSGRLVTKAHLWSLLE